MSAEPLCRVTFLPSGKCIEVPAGTSLFDATRLAKIPLASSCDGDAICGKCRVELVTESAPLSPISPAEDKLLQKIRDEGHYRIACEARILGDVSITTGYW